MRKDGRVSIKGFSGHGGCSGLRLILIILLSLSAALYYFYYRKNTGKTGDSASTAVTITIPDDGPVDLKTFEEAVTPPSTTTADRVDRALKGVSEALKAGDYTKAQVLLRVALKESPDSPELKKTLAGTLNRLALDEYNAGNFTGAKALLTEAAGLSSESSFVINMAVVQIRLKDLKGAAATLEPVNDDPKAKKLLKNVYSELGDGLHRGGDIKASIDFLEKGLAIDPTDASLNERLKRLRSEYDSTKGMDSSVGSHFLVRFDGGENAVTGHLIGLLLEEAYIKVGSDLGYYPEDKVEAILYGGERFHDITGTPSWAGAIYDGRIKIPAGGITERTERIEKAIFHEYTHAVVHRVSGGRAPVWLNEGIAQYEEGKDDSAFKAALKDLALKDKLRLRSYEGSFMGLSQDNADAAYLLSLSATAYLIREFGIFSVKGVLEGLGKGKTLDEAVSSALFLSYDDFEKSWLDSLKR